jgi:hypothetical protein
MWHLVSFAEHERWTVITFRRYNRRRQITGYETVYYHEQKPELTHVGMVARRKGDQQLIDVSRAVVAYVRLTEKEHDRQFDFKVRKI